MREWLEVLVTESGLVVAQQTIQRPPLMVAQMTEEWLNYYRKIAQSNTVPGASPPQFSIFTLRGILWPLKGFLFSFLSFSTHKSFLKPLKTGWII